MIHQKLNVMLIAVLCLFVQAKAADGLTVTPSSRMVSENFDSMWDAVKSEATLTMPDGWRIDRQMAAPRMVGAYSNAAAEVMYTGGTSLASNAKNGTWNFGSSATPSDRAVGGLSTTVDGGTRCVSVMTKLVNGGTEPVNQLTISYDIEKYRKGDNEAGFTVQLYYSYDGTTWKKAGDDFKTTFAKDNETLGAEVVPITTTTVSNKTLNTAVAVGDAIYLAWNISVSSGTSPNKAMGLALDNVSLTVSFGEPQEDPNAADPNRPPFVSSGIFLRGEVNGWGAVTEWEFSNEGNGTYVLYDKELSGAFKVADSNWSSACNYGSNGSAMTADKPYALLLGTDANISCAYTYDCARILLTITPDGASLLLESKAVEPGEPSVLQSVALMPADVTLVPQLPEKVKVLSLNNSLIHYNDQAAMFNDIAQAMGKDAWWLKHTMLGKPLSTHWDEGDGLGADGTPSAKMLIRNEAWSHIILQEQSGLPRTNVEAFRNNVKKWVEYIREYCPNPNAIIIVPLNWAYSGDWANFTDFNKMFLDNYLSVARETGVTICPVGVAYQQVYDDKGAEGIAPWFQDDRHPTDMSTYMAACMEYGLIFGVDPLTITSHPDAVSDADAAAMRAYASKALKGFTNIVDHTAATVRYQAVGFDQYGKEMDAPADFDYALTAGGTLDASHVFKSNGTEGTYQVTAKNETYNLSATVKVAHAETQVVTFPAIELNADKLSAQEDFNLMGTAADATLPTAWRIDRQTSAPRTLGAYAVALDKTMYAGGASLPSNAKNGLWNFGQDDSSDRAVGGITTGVAEGTRCINVYAHFLNTGVKNIEDLTISYDVEKYRKGNNAAGFTVQMYYSLDGRNWTSAGSDFCTTFAADAATEGYATVPGDVRSVSAVLDAKMQPGVDFYLAWNITVTSSDNAAGAMALAIDNFQLKGKLPAVPTAKHYVYVIDETGYDALGLYAWGDGELFGAWPGENWVDEKTIDGQVYKVFLLDAESGSYHLIFNNWNNGKQLPDFDITANRDYYLRVTATTVTEETTNSIQSITAARTADSNIYDLQGRKRGTVGDRLPKGLYVFNGKKYVIQ
jgi:hypothetical protein